VHTGRDAFVTIDPPFKYTADDIAAGSAGNFLAVNHASSHTNDRVAASDDDQLIAWFGSFGADVTDARGGDIATFHLGKLVSSRECLPIVRSHMESPFILDSWRITTFSVITHQIAPWFYPAIFGVK
jgi:hypothetical protein